MELELGRQHTLILAHLGHQAKVMGSHHGPAGEKKSQDPVGVVDGSFPGMVACQGPSAVVAGGRRKSKNLSRLRLFPKGPNIQSSVLPDGKLSLLTDDHVIAI